MLPVGLLPAPFWVASCLFMMLTAVRYRDLWAGPLFLPIMFLMVDPWTCIFSDGPRTVSTPC